MIMSLKSFSEPIALEIFQLYRWINESIKKAQMANGQYNILYHAACFNLTTNNKETFSKTWYSQVQDLRAK